MLKRDGYARTFYDKYPKTSLLVAAGASALLAASCSSSQSSSTAANGSSASASASRSPNTSPSNSTNAYAIALTYIQTLTGKCVALGADGKALTTQGGSAGEPTTQDFWVSSTVSDTGGSTSPLVQKGQCETYPGGVSAHVQYQGGDRWSMSATTTESGVSIVYIQHALDGQVIGTSSISPGSSDSAPVTDAYDFMNAAMADATTNPS